jgi:hypothetical protein
VIAITEAVKPNVPAIVSHARSFQLCGSVTTVRSRLSQPPVRGRYASGTGRPSA